MEKHVTAVLVRTAVTVFAAATAAATEHVLDVLVSCMERNEADARCVFAGLFLFFGSIFFVYPFFKKILIPFLNKIGKCLWKIACPVPRSLDVCTALLTVHNKYRERNTHLVQRHGAADLLRQCQLSQNRPSCRG